MLSSTASREAFELNREPDSVRERYGRTQFGQSVLLSRRLVEAGVSLVQVNWCRVDGEPNGGSWDTHDRHNDLLKRYLMPWMDRAYSALLTDLADRGLLEETLVLWVGEFGHTPKFNARAGRDHAHLALRVHRPGLLAGDVRRVEPIALLGRTAQHLFDDQHQLVRVHRRRREADRPGRHRFQLRDHNVRRAAPPLDRGVVELEFLLGVSVGASEKRCEDEQ